MDMRRTDGRMGGKMRYTLYSMLGIGFIVFMFYVHSIPLTFDEQYIYDYAIKIHDGQLPYKDFNIHYGPMSYIVWGGVLKVFGTDIWNFRLFGIFLWCVWFLSTSYIVYKNYGLCHSMIWFLCNLLFFQESPIFCIANYLFVMPFVMLLAVNLNKFVSTGWNGYITKSALITTAIVLWRYDTAVVLFGVCTLIMLIYRPHDIVLYWSSMICLMALYLFALTRYTSIDRLMDSIYMIRHTASYYHADFWGGFLPHKPTQILLRFPIWAPIFMVVIGIGHYLMNKDRMCLILTLFILAMYNQVIFCCEVPHATPCNILVMFMGIHILKHYIPKGAYR